MYRTLQTLILRVTSVLRLNLVPLVPDSNKEESSTKSYMQCF